VWLIDCVVTQLRSVANSCLVGYVSVTYRSLLNRMHLTFTAWVESLNTRDDVRGKTYRSCQKHHAVSLHYLLSTGHHLLGVTSITSLKSNLCITLTPQNTVLDTENTTVFQHNVFLTEMRLLLVTNKGPSAFPNVNHCQGQLQTPRSLAVTGKQHSSRRLVSK
jgi:hypothetical protein